MKASIMHDGSFVIPNVPAGTYILSVLSPSFSFDGLRIDVQHDVAEIRPYAPGTPLEPASTVTLSHPIILTPRHKHVFFIPRDSFNLLGMLANPMMLMMIAGGGMVFAMPYLTKNMDPESMEELKAQQAKLHSAMSTGDIKAGFSALMSDEQLVNKPAPATPATKSRGNKNKRH